MSRINLVFFKALKLQKLIHNIYHVITTSLKTSFVFDSFLIKHLLKYSENQFKTTVMETFFL